jgi:RNA polymerase sigma-70 factor (sigma-E family)
MPTWGRTAFGGALDEVRSAEEEFVEFADAASLQLQRTAFLLCGNWHTAEDLAQTTLAKMFVSWRKINRRGAVYAYANRILVNTYLDGKRLKRSAEILTDGFPDRAAEPPALETRLVVLAALATLPPKARAVVILRFWEDLSVEQVADVMGCSPGNVKSHTARALEKLRAVLDEAMDGCGPAARDADGRHEMGDRRHG